MTGVSSRSAEMILKYLQRDNFSEKDRELVPKVFSLLELISYKFKVTHPTIISFFQHKILHLS